MLTPDDVVLFGHDDANATDWERERIGRLRLRRVPVDKVAADPVAGARRAVGSIEAGHERYVVHLDVDVIDFTDAPLSENTGRNMELSLATAMTALRAVGLGAGGRADRR